MVAKIKDRDQVSKLVNINSSFLESSAKVLDIISESGAILDGHFSFGDCHSSNFLRFKPIGQRIENCDYLARLLVEQAKIDPDEETPLKVLSPESSGFFLAHSTAKLFVCNQQNAFKKLALAGVGLMDRRPVGGFIHGIIKPGNRVVVVNDIDRTGESLDRLIKFARRQSATVEAVLVFATCDDAAFNQRMTDLGVKGYSLAEFKLQTFQKDDCPLCASGDKDIIPVSTIV